MALLLEELLPERHCGQPDNPPNCENNNIFWINILMTAVKSKPDNPLKDPWPGNPGIIVNPPELTFGGAHMQYCFVVGTFVWISKYPLDEEIKIATKMKQIADSFIVENSKKIKLITIKP